MSNDKIRQRVQNIYATFVTDVDPNRLSDYLKQESIISIEQWEDICVRNTTTSSRCRALLDFLLARNHPRAFVVVRSVLEKENHYLLVELDNDTSCITEDELSATMEAVAVKETETDELSATLETADEVNGSETGMREKTLKLKEKLKQELNEVEQRKMVLKQEKLRLLAELRYVSDPVLVQTIQKKKQWFKTKRKDISGLTILDKELFVVSEESSEVEVYYSMNFSLCRRFNLKELDDPSDIASCDTNKCIYINNTGTGNILRVDPIGKIIRMWSTMDALGISLSVTDELCVILAMYLKCCLIEYSPDGQFLRQIDLSPDLHFGKLLHAIKLTNGHFVISLGSLNGVGMQRVCIVDEDGNLKKSFDEKRESTMCTDRITCPVYLSVDRNGFVMIIDRANNRVLLLDSGLEFKRNFLSKQKHALGFPCRILLDESNGRLFVADNEPDNERISIFQFK